MKISHFLIAICFTALSISSLLAEMADECWEKAKEHFPAGTSFQAEPYPWYKKVNGQTVIKNITYDSTLSPACRSKVLDTAIKQYEESRARSKDESYIKDATWVITNYQDLQHQLCDLAFAGVRDAQGNLIDALEVSNNAKQNTLNDITAFDSKQVCEYFGCNGKEGQLIISRDQYIPIDLGDGQTYTADQIWEITNAQYRDAEAALKEKNEEILEYKKAKLRWARNKGEGYSYYEDPMSLTLNHQYRVLKRDLQEKEMAFNTVDAALTGYDLGHTAGGADKVAEYNGAITQFSTGLEKEDAFVDKKEAELEAAKTDL